MLCKRLSRETFTKRILQIFFSIFLIPVHTFESSLWSAYFTHFLQRLYDIMAKNDSNLLNLSESTRELPQDNLGNVSQLSSTHSESPQLHAESQSQPATQNAGSLNLNDLNENLPGETSASFLTNSSEDVERFTLAEIWKLSKNIHHTTIMEASIEFDLDSLSANVMYFLIVPALLSLHYCSYCFNGNVVYVVDLS